MGRRDDAEDGFDGAGAAAAGGFAIGGASFFGHCEAHGVGELLGRLAFVQRPPVAAPFGVGVFTVDAEVKVEPGALAGEAFEGGFVGGAAVGAGGGPR